MLATAASSSRYCAYAEGYALFAAALLPSSKYRTFAQGSRGAIYTRWWVNGMDTLPACQQLQLHY